MMAKKNLEQLVDFDHLDLALVNLARIVLNHLVQIVHLDYQKILEVILQLGLTPH